MAYSDFIEKALRDSGNLAMRSFGHIKAASIMVKADPKQLVTEVDIASEKLIITAITSAYPSHAILAEESGFTDKNSEYTWVIDPIDGTSNFAHGVSWFGVMIALLKGTTPIAAGIYLPATDEIFLAEKGGGLRYNGGKVLLENNLIPKQSLISYCADYKDDGAYQAFVLSLYKKLSQEFLAVRCTNSSADYAYGASGKLAAVINLANKIWDVAAVALLAEEAGCIISDIKGNAQDFSIKDDILTRNYTLVISHPELHSRLIRYIRESNG